MPINFFFTIATMIPVFGGLAPGTPAEFGGLAPGTPAATLTDKLPAAEDCLLFGQQSFANLEFALGEEWTARGLELLRGRRPPDPSAVREVEEAVEKRAKMVGFAFFLNSNQCSKSYGKIFVVHRLYSTVNYMTTLYVLIRKVRQAKLYNVIENGQRLVRTKSRACSLAPGLFSGAFGFREHHLWRVFFLC